MGPHGRSLSRLHVHVVEGYLLATNIKTKTAVLCSGSKLPLHSGRLGLDDCSGVHTTLRVYCFLSAPEEYTLPLRVVDEKILGCRQNDGGLCASGCCFCWCFVCAMFTSACFVCGVLGHLKGMALGHECEMPLTGAKIAAIEAEIAVGPSCTYG